MSKCVRTITTKGTTICIILKFKFKSIFKVWSLAGWYGITMMISFRTWIKEWNYISELKEKLMENFPANPPLGVTVQGHSSASKLFPLHPGSKTACQETNSKTTELIKIWGFEVVSDMV